ncbi:VPS15 protein kinase [Pyricularia oryzae 70-15]|uniref:non-specific serine/threonine protein kinase n=1 Tax=Pyricularia oryzae (strain 70-15 / ATCC MYA-4617 / FGSC 8958) TaxID=242507 RepID=G4N5A1_PYRO7|nr:VPS15 protein kinase [Pyricularia oryzae 70-15]EHA52159.1 VPS15 protein kinase [Pyricularia oryzae 70-15]KAI7928462.1 VPS15 protein kinase [Pyricularia oryzae]
MGQGLSLTSPPAGSAGIDIPELGDLVYEKSVGTARFLKCIRARHHDGVVLVKVLTKPYTPMPLDDYRQEIIRESKALADVPNALAYQRVIETDTNGYLVRQYLYNSLYDRFSTRPFLEDIEKKWLAFQLLCALRDCHSRDIYHGDIKTENTLVTSWNWLYLSDFSSSFKPVILPDDNPADFSYFFDTSGRRTCYIAPERFQPAGDALNSPIKLNWAMDIFSAGCVIAELFTEAPIFSLSQLYNYRSGKYDPAISHLSHIPDKDLREMIIHMIQLDPQKRYSAEDYLRFWRKTVFPDYFYDFLHQYMEVITDPSSGQYPISGATRNLGEADERIDRVFYDFDKISYSLGYQHNASSGNGALVPKPPRLGLGHFPIRLNIPNHEHYVSSQGQPPSDDGSLIFLALICSSIRNTARAASKIRACDILLAFSERITDEAKLDRVVPYLMTLLNDKADMVVITAIRTITQVLALVKVVTPVNSPIFLEYILPRMQVALTSAQANPSPLVRMTYASCLGTLATTAGRYLDIAGALRAEGAITVADPEVEPGSTTAFDGMFEHTRHELVIQFELHVKLLIEDPDPFVRRAFLSSVPELCMFFGTADSNDIILAHLNTYLNDRDWTLKCALFDTIVGIAAFIGSTSLDEFILPLMVQALMDTEENVVQGALHSLAELAELGLLSKSRVCELVEVVARFTMHPNIWIRESATEFIAMATKYLTAADIRCMVYPIVTPYLKPGITPNFSELALLGTLRRPLTRPVFDQALLWALKSDRGLFWKPLQKARALMLGNSPAATGNGRGSSEHNPGTLGKVARNEEDEQWLSRLRNLGLSQEDEHKLLSLREFIWRLSQMKTRDSASARDEDKTSKQLNNIILLRTLGVTPQMVFFDEEPKGLSQGGGELDGAPRTITDALRDASMSIDDPVARRRRAALNSHRTRLNSRNSLSPMSIEGRMSLDDEMAGAPSSTSPGLLSPPGDGEKHRSNGQGPKRTLRHQSSALSLLNRKDNAKSGAETGMTEANAFGQVGGPSSQASKNKPLAADAAEDPLAKNRPRANHSYEGNDPNILRMLDSMYVDNYPHDVAEFGPLVAPIARRRVSRPATADGSEQGWRPAGKLVATFSEHTGAINRVVPSPDHVFFITGGDDGTVRVWDTARLERNIAHRSRAVYSHAPGVRVLSLCFIQDTHCFVSCGSDGSVHIVKVECSMSGDVTRYNKQPRMIRRYQLNRPGEFAVWCEHYKQQGNGSPGSTEGGSTGFNSTTSTLILATNMSRVEAIDLRNTTLIWALENPVHHGTPTCFCLDRKRNWLCLGTSHGVLDLWDLRFKVRLKAWGVPGKGAVYRLAVHPTKGRGRWVCVAGGTGQGEVTVWDLEKTTCREVYRVGGNKEAPRDYSAWEVDEDKPEGMLGRFATDIETGEAPHVTGGSDRGVRAMVVGSSSASVEVDNGGGGGGRDIRYAYILTAGSDKKLRFWDLSRIENSTVFSGIGPEEPRPSFTASHPTTALTLNTERLPRQSVGAAGDDGKGKGRAKTARSTVVSIQQQQLLRSHLDAVLDVAVIESPYTMTVSVDRMGVVFVFQ